MPVLKVINGGVFSKTPLFVVYFEMFFAPMLCGDV